MPAGQLAPNHATPSLARRLACLAYEALMLFGIGLVPGAAGALLVRVLGAEGAWQVEGALRAFAFVVYGSYFVWFWSSSGQTLPMQTWHIRVVTEAGCRLTRRHALMRFLLACAWVLPGWLVASLAGWHGAPVLAAVGVNIAAYAVLTLVLRERQFWHDVVGGTRLVVCARAQARPLTAQR